MCFRWLACVGWFGLGVSALLAAEGDRPTCWIGYTEGRNDLPSGQFENWRTNRAYVVRGDGTGRRIIADELATQKENSWTQFAGWSPDGSRAVVLSLWESPENAAWERANKTFRMTEGWLVDSCLVDLLQGKVTNLTEVERVSIYNTGLFYLPNGKGLGFTPLINGVSKPFVMDRDGRNKRDVSGSGGGFAYGYTASPDGKRICYHENYQIFVSNTDGTEKQKIETGNSFNFGAQWSRDGERLLFLSGQHYDCHPYVVRKDGSELKKLADRGGYRGVVERLKHPDFHSESSDIPVWANDGKSIYYTAKVGESIELMQAKMDGTVKRLTKSKPAVRYYHPTPSPDGKWLLFGSDCNGDMQLFVARSNGADARRITDVPAGSCAMHGHWQPIIKDPIPPSPAPTLSEAEKAAGWKLLFDGESTAGWRGLGREDFPSCWIVEGHHLRCLGGYKDACDLVAMDTYEDFEFSFEWRFPKTKGNSGVKYRVQETLGKSYAFGPEYQLMNDPDSVDRHSTGSLYDLVAPQGKQLVAQGEFNHSKIVVQGQQVEHWLNGVRVVAVDFASEELSDLLAKSYFKKSNWGQERRGLIALQNHHSDILFRNIKILVPNARK